MGAILVALSTLYVFTWYRIYTESRKLKTNLGNSGSVRNAALKSAKAMCLFVVVYIIQWTPVTVYGTWQLISDVPFELFLAVVIMTNLSGVYSGAIWLFNMSNKNSVSNKSTGEANLDMTVSKGRSTYYTDQSSTIQQWIKTIWLKNIHDYAVWASFIVEGRTMTYSCTFMCRLVSCGELSHWQSYHIFFVMCKYIDSFSPYFTKIYNNDCLWFLNTIKVCCLNRSKYSDKYNYLPPNLPYSRFSAYDTKPLS